MRSTKCVGGECVEVYRKSSKSGGDNCVEVGFGEDFIKVRDSKDKNSSELLFTVDEWEAFVKGVKAGEFDL